MENVARVTIPLLIGVNQMFSSIWGAKFTAATALTLFMATTIDIPNEVNNFNYAYMNDNACYVLSELTGTATFQQDGKAWFTTLTHVRAESVEITFRGRPLQLNGQVYATKNLQMFLFFSDNGRPSTSKPGTTVHDVCSSTNGTVWKHLLTDSGTRRYPLSDGSIADFQAGFSGQQTGNPQTFPIETGTVEHSYKDATAKMKAKLSERGDTGFLEATVYLRERPGNGTGYASGIVSLYDQKGNTIYKFGPVKKQLGAVPFETRTGEESADAAIPQEIMKRTFAVGVAVKATETTGGYERFEDFHEDLENFNKALKTGTEIAQNGAKLYYMAQGGP